MQVACSTDGSGLLHWRAHLVGNAGAVPLLVVNASDVANDLVSLACVIALLANVLLDRSELAILVFLVIYKNGNLGVGSFLPYEKSGLVELGDVDCTVGSCSYRRASCAFSCIVSGLCKKRSCNIVVTD